MSGRRNWLPPHRDPREDHVLVKYADGTVRWAPVIEVYLVPILIFVTVTWGVTFFVLKSALDTHLPEFWKVGHTGVPLTVAVFGFVWTLAGESRWKPLVLAWTINVIGWYSHLVTSQLPEVQAAQERETIQREERIKERQRVERQEIESNPFLHMSEQRREEYIQGLMEKSRRLDQEFETYMERQQQSTTEP